jgi:hypothetical protein
MAASGALSGMRFWRANGLRRNGHWLPDETVAAFNEYLVGIKARSLRLLAAASVR